MKKYFIVSLSVVVVFLLSGVANAASVIGTNMSTTGTFLQTVGSATAARFQNAAGTINVLVVDSVSNRVGVGAVPGTTFEVQGTASASYLLAGSTIQVGGYASADYSRFGTAATTHSGFITTTNDLVINGDFEVDGKAFFDGTASVASNFEVGGTASVSGIIYLADGQIRPETSGDGATAFRFQNAAGTISVLTIDTTNWRVGIGKTPSTIFDVKGTASAAYGFFNGSLQVAGTTGASVAYSRFGTGTTNTPGDMDAANDLLITGSLEVDGKASVAGNFQTSGRFIADTAASHSMVGDMILTSALTVGATTASSSGGSGYTAEFVAPVLSTASFYFGSSGVTATKGTCFQLKSTTGAWIYMRFRQGDTSPLLSTIRCQ